MNHYRSLVRVLLPCALIVAANAGIACGQLWGDPNRFQNQYKPWGKFGPTISVTSPTKVWNGLSGRPNQRVARRTSQRVVSSRAERLADLNLAVNLPSGAWSKLDPQATGSRAKYLIIRSKPTIMISLAGERVSTDNNSSLLAESQAKMKSLPGGSVVPGERQLTAGGIPGVAYKATVTDGQHTTYYSMWVAAHGGYNYKLAVYGDHQHKPAIDAALHDFLRGLQQLHLTARGGGNTRR